MRRRRICEYVSGYAERDVDKGRGQGTWDVKDKWTLQGGSIATTSDEGLRSRRKTEATCRITEGKA